MDPFVILFVANVKILGRELSGLGSASGSFVGTLVVFANVSKGVVSNGVLDVIRVFTVDNKPWNVLVWWIESFGSESITVF